MHGPERPRAIPRPEPDPGAHARGVRGAAIQSDAQPRLRPLVPEHADGSAILGDRKIRPSIAVEVGHGSAPRFARLRVTQN